MLNGYSNKLQSAVTAITSKFSDLASFQDIQKIGIWDLGLRGKGNINFFEVVMENIKLVPTKLMLKLLNHLLFCL